MAPDPFCSFGHEAVGEDADGETPASIADDADECVVVVGLVEDPCASVAAVGDVVAVVGLGGPDGACHGIGR